MERPLTLRHGGAPAGRYGRRLAHLADADGICLQGALLAAGMTGARSFADNRPLVTGTPALERAARVDGLRETRRGYRSSGFSHFSPTS